MKKLFLLFLVFSTSLKAQFQIKGKVKSVEEGDLAFATLTLHAAKDSAFIKAEAADEKGVFLFKNIKPAQYFIKSSFVSYASQSSKVFDIKDANLELADFILKQENQLKELKVTATKPLIEVKPDKMVFNVQSSLASTGTTGLELLRKAPGVVLDNNENIIISGKSGVRIFIDGKPSPLTGDDLKNYLKNLQSSDIESIEIITQPSSKYDAAGTAGILNIKLKKDSSLGTKGTLNLGSAYGVNFSSNGSVSFNHREKKSNLFASLNAADRANFNFINLYRQQLGGVFDSQAYSTYFNNNYSGRFSYDYYLSKKATLGIMASMNQAKGKNIAENNTYIQTKISEPISSILESNNSSTSNNKNYFLNANYRFEGPKSFQISADLDWGMYDNYGFSFQPNVYYNATKSQKLFENNFEIETPKNIQLISSQVDATKNINGYALAAGLKFSQVNTQNDFNFYNITEEIRKINTGRTNAFAFTENISAAYVNINKKIKKLDTQWGLRAEHTLSNGQLESLNNQAQKEVKRDYLNFFPSAGVSYNLNPKNSFSLNYSKRIERPSYESLNPFEYQLDELTFRKGNAFLQPQYIHNFKLSHTYKYTLTTHIGYSRTLDFMAEITDTLGTNKSFLMQRNMGTQQNLDFGLSYPFSVNKFWSVYTNVSTYRVWFRSFDPKFVPLEINAMQLYAQNTLKLPKKWSAEVSGWFTTPTVWGATYKTGYQGSLDLALSRKILKEKISFRASFTDILYTSQWRGTSKFGDLIIKGNGGWESRQLRVNLSYNFGNSKVKESKQRSGSAEDLRKRI
jgi:iron complex outermembrane recepter protein